MKKLIALAALALMVTVSSVAYAQSSSVTVNTTVGSATSISAACWTLSGTYQWTGTSLGLVQPGDFTGAGTDGIADDPADDYTPAGTAVYTTLGGNPASSLTGENFNAFGYGDCKATISTNDLTWQIDLKADAFDNAGGTADIDDIAGAGTIGFDYDLDNNETTTPYAATDEEHGFYVVSDSATLDALMNADDGTAFGVTYTTANDYDLATCGGGAEPCYHGLENTNGQVIYDNTAAGLSADEFVTRFGVGVDSGTAADTYSMTATYTITI